MTNEITTQAYINFCRQMWNYQNKDRDVQHALLGIASEVGELLSCYKKEVGYGRELDVTNILEECGDLLYFTTIFYDIMFPENEENLDIFNIPFSTLEDRQSSYVSLFSISTTVGDIMFKPQMGELFSDISYIYRNIFSVLKYHNFTIAQGIAANMNKLNVRYPGKYDPKLSLERDLKAERESLENDASKTE